MGQLVRVNNTIRVISLGFCSIEEEGAVAIAEGLEDNLAHTSIRYIDLEGNDISRDLIAELKKMIRSNSSNANRSNYYNEPDSTNNNNNNSNNQKNHNSEYLRKAMMMREEMMNEDSGYTDDVESVTSSRDVWGAWSETPANQSTPPTPDINRKNNDNQNNNTTSNTALSKKDKKKEEELGKVQKKLQEQEKEKTKVG